jgi:hypothetical protein
LSENGTYPEDERTEAVYFIHVNDINRPHGILEISPETGMVHMLENESQEFSVFVTEPDGDDLQYLWKVGNHTFQGFGNTTFNSSFSGSNSSEDSPVEITLLISDGRSPEFNISLNWTVHIYDVDRPFRYSLNPSPGNLTMKSNETISFSFNATDPDGSSVGSQWRYLNRTLVNTTSLILAPSNLGLTGGENLTIDLLLHSGNSTVTVNWTLFIEKQDPEPPVDNPTIPPVGAVIISPPGGAVYDFNETVHFRAETEDERVLNYGWVVDGIPYNGSVFSISDLEAGTHSVYLNISSMEMGRPGWIEFSYEFIVREPVEIEDKDPSDGDKSEKYPLWLIMVVIIASALIVVFVLVLIFLRRGEDSESWEE